MEETQTNLEIGIGTKESISLKPTTVKIEDAQIEKVGDKGNEILKCTVKHPDKEETIKVSEVKYESKDKKLSVSALWVNKDDDGLIRKGSALATFLNFVGVKNPKELIGKEVSTVLDEKGYLAFKSY